MREVNRLQEMEVFLAVLDEGSFSAAALRRQMTPSAVSKMMTRLESRLGATLLRRTTRRVQVTDEGLAFARAARDVLATLDQAEREVGCGPVAGVVRIATSAAYANHILAPVLPELLCAHRDLDLGLIIGDAITDLSGQPVDLAIRAGPLPDSSLQARSLGMAQVLSVQAPGAPGRADRLWLCTPRPALARRHAPIARHRREHHRAAGGGGMRQCPASAFVVRAALEAGTLEIVPGSDTGTEEFHLVYLGKAASLPARIAVVADFLTRRGRVTPHAGQ